MKIIYFYALFFCARVFLPIFNRTAVSDLTFVSYTKTVKRKI